MDFKFSKEEELWKWAVKDFADRELARKELKKFDGSFRDIVRKMGDLGFLGVTLPTNYGGDPANWVMFGMLIEEIARANAGMAYFILISHEISSSLATFATDETKTKWLPGLIQGDIIGCVASTEPNAGSDFDAIAARAEKHGDQYRIIGQKVPVSFGMEADIALTFVQTESGGSTAVAIPLDLSGISKSPEPVMGMVISAPASITFNSTSIPMRYRIGQEGDGRRINANTGLLSSTNQIASGLISLGMAQTALKLAIKYSKKRYAFGKPIAKFEAISQKIAEHTTLLEAGKWLCYRALSLKDRGNPHSKEAAMCGWWCPKISYQAIQDSLLIHGHSGYSDDHPFEQMLRDVVAFEIISGTEQILKHIISHQVIGPTGVPDCLLGRMSNF